jgi:N-acyl-D-aspartate/D-glutamate deacylase
MQSVDHRRSPFFSAAFLRRLQKMISTDRGPATQIERAIERALRRLASRFSALGR